MNKLYKTTIIKHKTKLIILCFFVFIVLIVLIVLIVFIGDIYGLYKSNTERFVEEEDGYSTNDDIEGDDVILKNLETDKVIHTTNLCIGETCINDLDLNFFEILPYKNDKNLCIGDNCVTKTHFEYLNTFSKPGLIVAFFGKLSDLPDNWKLCNGKNGTPDLRNKFILGSGKKYKLGESGGKDRIVIEEDNLPSHSHDMNLLTSWEKEFEETADTKENPNDKPLLNKGDSGCGYKTCGECEGDCDGDGHCKDGLKCFQRSYSEKIPGCSNVYPEGSRYAGRLYGPRDQDYCYKPTSHYNPNCVVNKNTTDYKCNVGIDGAVTGKKSDEGVNLKTDKYNNPDFESVDIMPPYKSLYYIMKIETE